MGLFSSDVMMSGGGKSSGFNGSIGGSESSSFGPTKIGETEGLQGFSGYAGAALSLVQAGMNISSYSSQAKQYGKQATNAFSNILAIEDNYDLNKWILRQKAVKTYGAINVRMGEGGSAMDLLQESAKNVGIEQYKLHEQYLMNKYQAYKDYRKAKASQKAAQSGQIGAAIGTVAAIAAAPFTGGASLAFAGMASQVGGQVGSSLR